MSVLGFILQPTYRLEERRPIVHLYGLLESGESFLVRDDRLIPHFYIEARQGERAKELGASRVRPSARRNFQGLEMARVDLERPSDTPSLRIRLRRQGIRCYEADVRFAMRYLIDLGIRGSLEIEGRWRPWEGISRLYENPVCRPAGWTPELRVLSLDIETDPEASRLLSIALHGCGHSGVLLHDPRPRPTPAFAHRFGSQKELLEAFVRRIRQIDPDLITGWNVVDFDLKVLSRIASSEGISLQLGRDSGPLRLRPSRFPWSSLQAQIPGRVVVDGIHLLRGSFLRMGDYSLDAVARRVLGEGKVLAGHGRPEEILRCYQEDLGTFLEYNLTDARLALEILERLQVIALAVERSRLTGLPVERVAGSIASFDFLYLSELHRRRVVAPSVGSSDTTPGNPGGHVLKPQPGLHRNVLVFDFRSLYPSIIRTFQIDPLGWVEEAAEDADLIVAPNGAKFRREKGILPGLLDELFPRREAAQAAGDTVASHAIKILMNSFYGVLGTPACRFFEPQLAGAITTFGRELLLWSKQRFEDYGYQVLYGDTDSLFVDSGESDPEKARRIGEDLPDRLNRDLADYVAGRWRVESRLELEFERLYLKLHLPPMRHGRGGACKRYAGLVAHGESSRLRFTGMEVVRSDWTELAKQVQRELYRRLFEDQDVRAYLGEIVGQVRGGQSDHLLVYRKALRKKLPEYTATTPPHVTAARKLSRPPGRVIEYLMTVRGAEPAEERQSPIDYEHYVQRQVRPVAQPILDLLGLDFAKVIGDDRQLELF